MKREVLLEDIRKDRLLKSGDAASLDAAGCSGCSYCCCEMTDTIILDPWDVYMLVSGLKAQKSDMASAVLSLESLLAKRYADLAVFEGLTLPHLAFHKDKRGIPCIFLDENGRCSIHGSRPGLCRLFPLGRYYEDGTFYYFLQSGECKKPERSEVTISEWLGIENLPAYEKFVLEWHEILENIKGYLKNCSDENAKKVNMMLLTLFYITPYNEDEGFYVQFNERRMKIL